MSFVLTHWARVAVMAFVLVGSLKSFSQMHPSLPPEMDGTTEHGRIAIEKYGTESAQFYELAQSDEVRSVDIGSIRWKLGKIVYAVRILLDQNSDELKATSTDGRYNRIVRYATTCPGNEMSLPHWELDLVAVAVFKVGSNERPMKTIVVPPRAEEPRSLELSSSALREEVAKVCQEFRKYPNR